LTFVSGRRVGEGENARETVGWSGVEVNGKNWISGAEWYDAMGKKEGEK